VLLNGGRSRTQVRCRDCTTGWVILNSQEDASSASHQRCEACLRKSNAHRTEGRAQDPKPRGRPPKQAQKKWNRGRKLKSDLRDRFGDSLHVTAQIDTDGDELPVPPPAAPTPAPRRRGRPPKQRPNDGDGTSPGTSPGTPSAAET
jgi:hypothetical protein